jgi:hypothetical protein
MPVSPAEAVRGSFCGKVLKIRLKAYPWAFHPTELDRIKRLVLD